MWARIEQACGLTPKPIFIAAETAWRMLTQRDPYVNMLRATIATFSAGLGGANAITVLPHTLALGLPDPFARRVARNTQLVLLEESNLAKVSDPAAGSGGIESLTQQLCEAAWTLFQEIEKAGGVFAALEQSLIQRKVAATRAVREAEHRPAQGRADRRQRIPQSARGRTSRCWMRSRWCWRPMARRNSNSTRCRRCGWPRRSKRLRDRSDQILKDKGARPKVFLANLGTAADFTARATFAKSFFETGGIEAVDTEGFTDPAALAAAFKASGAALACLCSSDKVYAGQAAAAAKALQAAGAKHIYLAGRPGEQEAALRGRRRQRFRLCRRRRADRPAGGLSADGVSMTAATKPVLTGGCQCGAIRFALSAPPVKVSICHCRMCQKASGAPFASFADIERADFAWTRGKPAAFRSSSIAERDFCADCGTPLSFRRIDGPRIEIMTGAFDRPDRVIPTLQYGTESRLGWVVGIANLPSQTTLQNYGPEKLSGHRQPPASGP